MWKCVLLTCVVFVKSIVLIKASSSNACYDDTGPVACFPPFVNPAFNRLFNVSNTCGVKANEHFCLQMVISGEEKWCDDCDATDESKAHPAKYLTDHNTPQNLTWWQSSSMLTEDIQYPNSINLTLGLGKTFEITYIRLKFRSSRPESFAIYKKVSEDQDWIPFQYYSSTCEGTYGLSPSQPITDDQATCRDDFSDISPLTDGTVAFSSLENRPSAYHYKDSPILHEWVTAKYIMISLDRLNTFRDEVFGDPLSLSSYFYAISDISMGGRCKCNGHARECVITGDELQCVCQHNTGGVNCDQCLPFFNDQPWRRSFVGQSFECKPCNCNGLSETCEFDLYLYHATGHGGRCTNCRENAGGPNCEICREGYYKGPQSNRCMACGCHHLGSEIPDCNMYGRCSCKFGVTGDKCDQCLPYHFNLSSEGCTKCQCNLAGIMPGSENLCDTITGHCHCKLHVGGRDCDQCIGGHYGLTKDNPFGCTACFCYGHSTECIAATYHMVNEIKSSFRSGKEGWQGISPSNEIIDVEHLDVTKEISLVSNDDQTYYFLAPTNFLGNILKSQNLKLSFDFRIEGGHGDPSLSLEDVVLQSADGRKLSIPIFIQNNKVPSNEKQHYNFVIGEHEFYGWSPHKMSNVEFGKFLSNITAFKIRANYVPQGMAFLSNVTLEMASMTSGIRSILVELCECPKEYLGQYCEACVPGYKRYPPNSGAFGICIPCQCNGHSDSCEMESGQCICQHNTVGLYCERCADGFYGNALNGTMDDCQPCLCPNGGRCTQLELTGDIVCLDCDEGYGGLKCDACVDGYYRNRDDSCVACDCNNNTDPNAVGTCQRETGECMKCLYNTTGRHCHDCLRGFYGEPTKRPHGECLYCACDHYGAIPLDEEDEPITTEELIYGGRGYSCNFWDGKCKCRDNVEGRQCDKCLEGTWGIYGGKGCEDCQCNTIGSYNSSCDVYSGQCQCRAGVTGLKCDQCLTYHYGFSLDGCTECKCNYYGSLNDSCDFATGACQCRPKYVGRACDQCDLNFYNLAVGCEECPICYQLLLEPYQEIKKKISVMHMTIYQVANLPPSNTEVDQEFKGQLDKIKNEIQSTSELMKNNGRFDDSVWVKNMTESLETLNEKFEGIVVKVGEAKHKLQNISVQLKTGKELGDGAKDELESAWGAMKDNGERLITELEEERRKSGSQSDRMTEIAKEGRDHFDTLEQNIKEMHNISMEAENKSKESVDITSSLEGTQNGLGQELRATFQLKDHLKHLHERTVNESVLSQLKATDALKMANDLLNGVEPIDLNEFINKATNTSKTSEKINDLKIKMDEHVQSEDELMSDFQFETFDLQLEMNKRSKQERVSFIERSKSSLNESQGAKARTEKIVKDAQDILANLQSFDENVQAHKQDSESAKLLVSDVRKNLQDAENFTSMADHQVMEEANMDAEESERLSVVAMVQVYNKTEELKKMKEEVDNTQESWDNIKERKSKEVETLDAAEKKIEVMEKEIAKNEEELDKLVEDLNATAYSLADHRRLLNSNNQKIQQLLSMLDALSEIDDSHLQKIEIQLDASETTLAASEIDRKYKELEVALANMRDFVENMEKNLKYLNNEVKQLGVINESIPYQCFREVTLEPGF